MFGITNTLLGIELTMIPEDIGYRMASDKGCEDCTFSSYASGHLLCTKYLFKTKKESICNSYE